MFGNLHMYIHIYKYMCVFHVPYILLGSTGLPSADILIWWFGENFTVGIHNWDPK